LRRMSVCAGTLALVKLPRPNENSGPLAGHIRRGRVYRSPLAATGVLFAADWVRDDLPDLLWPVLALSELGTAEGRRFVRWQKGVQDDLAGTAEVVAGLAARAGRDVIAALGAPDLWCMEHGAHIARVLVEVRIYIQWMARQDPSIYRAFQDYGAGKAKLYAKILDELPPEARRPDFEAAVGELQRLSRNSEILDNRVVDTRDSFAEGKSIRAMAEECGLLDLYRQTYYMASGVSHSEWWSIETHAMERCVNVLHGGHIVPSLSLNPGGNTEFAWGSGEDRVRLARKQAGGRNARGTGGLIPCAKCSTRASTWAGRTWRLSS
jgi:hypothetical protein